MRSEIVHLRKNHRPLDEFEGSDFVNSILRAESTHLRHMSQHGVFHEYVKKHGYPLPAEILRSSSYLTRPQLEKELFGTVERGRHAVVVGCEGSGKTTLIHYVFGTINSKNLSVALYVDTSDIEGTDNQDVEKIVLRKIANTINKISNDAIGQRFEEWVRECQSDVYLQSIVDVSNPTGLAEAFVAFLRTHEKGLKSYLILDNLDSLSVQANKILFTILNRIEETVGAICKRLQKEDNKNVRYIICCRTPTFQHISGTALGLFLNFPHEEILVEDDFIRDTNILGLINNFMLNPDGRVAKETRSTHAKIRLKNYSLSMSLGDYFSDTLKWLYKNEEIFDRIIKMFCGRSIRRAKLFSLKVLASPAVARLALLERLKAVSITKDNKDYLKRRLIEAMFEFDNTGATRFPMNPFRVIVDEMEFRANPLIGVLGILYLSDNRKALSDANIFFASSVNTESLVDYFEKLKYSTTAIKDFFTASLDSGLLRPVPSSKILIEDPVYIYRNVYSRYVIDDVSLCNLVSLILSDEPEISMIFYNSATRARYNLSGPRELDNMLVEAFTSLVFLSDFLEREKILAKKIKGTGIMVESPSSRFQSKMMSQLGGIISSFEKGIKKGNLNTDMQETLYQSKRLFVRSKMEIRKRSSIL